MQGDAEVIAKGLTEACATALVPLMCFSDKTGREMKKLGLLAERDGVWNHTALGMGVLKLRRKLKGRDHD